MDCPTYQKETQQDSQPVKDYAPDEWTDEGMRPMEFIVVCGLIVAVNSVWVGVGVFIGWVVWR